MAVIDLDEAMQTYFIALNSMDEFFTESEYLKDDAFDQCIDHCAKTSQSIAYSLNMGKKLLLCGNGDFAKIAQQTATEFTSIMSKLSQPGEKLEALALASNVSESADSGIDGGFARGVKEMGVEKDVLIGLCPSGDSQNIMTAFDVAKNAGVITFAMTGQNGGKLAPVADLAIKVPSSEITSIHKIHTTLCQAITFGVKKLLSMRG